MADDCFVPYTSFKLIKQARQRHLKTLVKDSELYTHKEDLTSLLIYYHLFKAS